MTAQVRPPAVTPVRNRLGRVSSASLSIDGLALRYSALVGGGVFVFAILMANLGLGVIPASYLLPFLPGAAVGFVRFITRYSPGRGPFLVLFFTVLAGLFWTSQTELFDGMLILVASFTTMTVSVLFNTRERWLVAANWFSVGTLASTIVLFLDFQQSGQNRLGTYFHDGGRLIDPNLVGTLVTATVIAQLAVIWNWPQPDRRLTYARFAFVGWLFYVVLLTGSRGSLLTLLVCIVIFLLFGIHRYNKWLLFGGLGTALTGMAIIWSTSGPPELLTRFTDSGIGTLGGRLPIWSAAYERANTYWGPARALLGEGTGSAPYALGLQAPELARLLGMTFYSGYDGGVPRVNAHSAYVEWLLTLGALGFLVGVYLLLNAIWSSFRVDRGRAGGAALAFVALFAMTSVTLVSYRMVGVSIACGALALGYIYIDRSEPTMNEPVEPPFRGSS